MGRMYLSFAPLVDFEYYNHHYEHIPQYRASARDCGRALQDLDVRQRLVQRGWAHAPPPIFKARIANNVDSFNIIILSGTNLQRGDRNTYLIQRVHQCIPSATAQSCYRPLPNLGHFLCPRHPLPHALQASHASPNLFDVEILLCLPRGLYPLPPAIQKSEPKDRPRVLPSLLLFPTVLPPGVVTVYTSPGTLISK